MSKVGILSMQRIKNYGSFLQAYGLKKVIEEYGHDVEFVDYHVEKPVIVNNSKNKNILTKGIEAICEDASFIQKIQYIKHKRSFGKKYYSLLNINEKFNYNPKLDTMVIGSDEVFNCIQSNSNVGYSLELFGKNNNAKRVISYAASFGNTILEKLEKYNKKEEIASLLKKFDKISVRDMNSKTIVDKLTNNDVDINLDPVLIFDFMNHKELIPNLNVKGKYMIVYAYSGRISKEESKFIKSFASKNKLKVYAIGGAQKCADKFIDCSPFEVLAYFKNAEFIITDTFHGSIFSIINNKKFTTIIRKSHGESYGNEEKLKFLLEKLSLNTRIIYSLDSIESIENKFNSLIDYSKTNSIIDNERKKAREFLKENL